MKNLIINLIKILVIFIILTIPVSSCDWLDVVPDNMPSIDDAFSNRASAEKSLFSCYSYLLDPMNGCFYQPGFFTTRDELEYSTHQAIVMTPAAMIAKGEQNINNPYLNYWSGGNGGINMFQAIRTCNIFLEEIHQPRDIQEIERKRWTAEVKFLKAYYHFFMLQLYGPIPLIKENLPISASPEEVMVFREPVDECVAYIAQLIDEAAPDLPLVVPVPVNEDGRITRPVALAVKAKVLAWGASPLFNGNTDYSEWRDSRGKQLVSDTYSKEKWVEAAEAIRNAINVCHEAKHKLYQYNKFTSAQTYNMNDSLVLTMHTRKAVTERWNSGTIWSSAISPAKIEYNVPLNILQRITFAPLYSKDLYNLVGYSCASFNMAELFYTNNGIPIDEDIHWDYSSRYQPRTSTFEDKNGCYIPIGQQTASLHFDREARFYANLGFDRGYFELAQTTNNGGASFNRYLGLRQGDIGSGSNQSITGYFPKKLTAFETRGDHYQGYDYRFPLFRLSDLYLLYSEALNELKDAPDNEVYEWIDYVRAIVGLPGVVDSWKNSRYPANPSDKNEMRKIIQRERLIELAFEGQRFWDMRRWKLAESSWSYKPVGWNRMGKLPEEYYSLINLTTDIRKYSVRDYLWPISISDLRANPNLVQTYGW